MTPHHLEVEAAWIKLIIIKRVPGVLTSWGRFCSYKTCPENIEWPCLFDCQPKSDNIALALSYYYCSKSCGPDENPWVPAPPGPWSEPHWRVLSELSSELDKNLRVPLHPYCCFPQIPLVHGNSVSTNPEKFCYFIQVQSHRTEQNMQNHFHLKNQDGWHLKKIPWKQVYLLHDVRKSDWNLLTEKSERLFFCGILTEI